MNIFELARDAGMLVVLDGRIGRTEYRSVHGTVVAFQRFVRALEAALATGEEGVLPQRQTGPLPISVHSNGVAMMAGEVSGRQQIGTNELTANPLRPSPRNGDSR
ncbi:hypothetical protein SAMN05446635_0383 [Burkholderia sp. OK233]|nr:hypothetical protein SAMN05446635_0383 [Burkholderia sp. OK233]